VVTARVSFLNRLVFLTFKKLQFNIRLLIWQRNIFVLASISVGGLKIINNYIYKMFNVAKSVRGSPLALGLPCLSFAQLHGFLALTTFTHLQHQTQHFTALFTSSKLATTIFMALSPSSGIEPGPPAWESSTLPSEPLDVRKNKPIFSTYIVNIHVHCILQFHLSYFIIKI
jgi:hypothetical protein